MCRRIVPSEIPSFYRNVTYFLTDCDMQMNVESIHIAEGLILGEYYCNCSQIYKKRQNMSFIFK
jgi:hypothetical protein